MVKPLDLLVRVIALPQLAWSASGAILDTRHRIAGALRGESENGWALSGNVFEGLFDRIEGQCRSKWCDGFGYMGDTPAPAPGARRVA